MDRDHFMDEFFEQVTELLMLLDSGADPQPTISFALFHPCSPLLEHLGLLLIPCLWPIYLNPD